MVDGLQDKNIFFNKVNEKQILLYIKITPNASCNQILGKQKNLFYEVLKIKIKSLPIDGKANKELLSFLALELKIRISEIKIIKGLTSTNKVISLVPNENLEKCLLELITKLPYLN